MISELACSSTTRVLHKTSTLCQFPTQTTKNENCCSSNTSGLDLQNLSED